ncbi:MAG: hypothetical protein V9E83_14020 [Baekduia sp.]
MWGERKAVAAEIGGRGLACLVCGGGEFVSREVKLNTSGFELLDLAWANESATGLVCTSCGYVHEFVGSALVLRDL